MHKVYIPWYDYAVGKLFKRFGYHIASKLEEADIVCFTGGEDIEPSLYLQPRHSSVYTNPVRDDEEVAVYYEALKRDLPMVGICRGGQLLNVLNGGSMIQDVTNHGRQHLAIIEGEEMLITSVHHQMMVPGENAIILGFGKGTGAIRTVYDAKDNIFYTQGPKNGVLDIEVLAYRTHLCIQGHPEYSCYKDDFNRFAEKTFEMIDKYCFAKEKEAPTSD